MYQKEKEIEELELDMVNLDKWIAASGLYSKLPKEVRKMIVRGQIATEERLTGMKNDWL